MSEPRQLYARIRLTRLRLDEFLASAFPDPSEDQDVLAWLDEASYYGDRYTPGDDGMLVYAYLFDEDDRPEVALRIRPGSATFIDEDAAESLIADANVAMEALIEEGRTNA